MDKKTIARFWSKVNKNGPTPAHCPELGPCWIWTAASDKDGYGAFSVTVAPRKYRDVRAHKFALELALMRSLTPGECALHHCDNPPCVNNEGHLWPGTIADNNRNAASKQRTARGDKNGSRRHPERLVRGESHPATNLRMRDIIEIRTLHASGRFSYSRLSTKFCTPKPTIADIVTRKTWRHVP